MVEFAIAASLLLLVLFGVLEFGRALYVYHTVDNAARIGARWAMVRGSASCTAPYPVDHCNAASKDVQTYVQSVVPVLDSGDLTVNASWPGTNPGCNAGPAKDDKASGCVVIVTASHAFNFAIPFVSGATLNIASTSQMTISQ
jgi:hypothetical protein